MGFGISPHEPLSGGPHTLLDKSQTTTMGLAELDLGERWPSRLVATAAEGGLILATVNEVRAASVGGFLFEASAGPQAQARGNRSGVQCTTVAAAARLSFGLI